MFPPIHPCHQATKRASPERDQSRDYPWVPHVAGEHNRPPASTPRAAGGSFLDRVGDAGSIFGSTTPGVLTARQRAVHGDVGRRGSRTPRIRPVGGARSYTRAAAISVYRAPARTYSARRSASPMPIDPTLCCSGWYHSRGFVGRLRANVSISTRTTSTANGHSRVEKMPASARPSAEAFSGNRTQHGQHRVWDGGRRSVQVDQIPGRD